jgi:hypothetical protein
MQVPWGHFHKAYEEYIRWQAFVLWARGVVELEGCAPSWLEAILRKRCPASPRKWLAQTIRNCWVSGCFHGFTIKYSGLQNRRGGWMRSCSMDSETPAPRDTGCIGNIATANGGNDGQRHFPFVQWMRSALSGKLEGDVSCAAVAKAVEKYLDFEAFAYWLRPLFQAPVQLGWGSRSIACKEGRLA